MTLSEAQRLVKSKQRVADHGEVFTPAWMVEDMLNLVKDESERIDSRVLEPACGSGNFLVPVLVRKLATVQRRHGRSEFEKRHYALFALMCTYGIELLADNAEECRDNLAQVFNTFLGVAEESQWAQAARAVLAVNIVQGDALTMTTPNGEPITFPEWDTSARESSSAATSGSTTSLSEPPTREPYSVNSATTTCSHPLRPSRR